jgi:hypothetical protein
MATIDHDLRSEITLSNISVSYERALHVALYETIELILFAPVSTENGSSCDSHADGISQLCTE